MKYLDTSALIKRFVLERGSRLILAIIKQQETINSKRPSRQRRSHMPRSSQVLPANSGKDITPTPSMLLPLSSLNATGFHMSEWTFKMIFSI